MKAGGGSRWRQWANSTNAPRWTLFVGIAAALLLGDALGWTQRWWGIFAIFGVYVVLFIVARVIWRPRGRHDSNNI
jgi:hypothetical protein